MVLIRPLQIHHWHLPVSTCPIMTPRLVSRRIWNVSRGVDSLFHFSVCSEQLASPVLPNGSEWTNAIGSCKPYIWLVTTIWTNLPIAAISHQWFPYSYIPWAAPDSDLRKTPMWSKLSVTFWLQALVTDMFYAATQGLLTHCD